MPARKARAERRRALARRKAIWRRRYFQWGITDENSLSVISGIRAGHPAHVCPRLCARRPAQRAAPRWRQEAAVEIAEETGSSVLPAFGVQKPPVRTRRDGHRRFG